MYIYKAFNMALWSALKTEFDTPSSLTLDLPGMDIHPEEDRSGLWRVRGS